MSDLVERLLQEWEGQGFFYLARTMKFDEKAAERLLRTLEDINPPAHPSGECAELLRRIWILPYYALVYRERCLEAGADERQYDLFMLNLEKKVSLKINFLISTCID